MFGVKIELTMKRFEKQLRDTYIAFTQAREAHISRERDDALTCAEFEWNMQNMQIKNITDFISPTDPL